MRGLGARPFEVSSLEACGLLPEGSSFRLGGLWWPPDATRCTAELPGGATVVRTYVPAATLVAVALAALAATRLRGGSGGLRGDRR